MSVACKTCYDVGHMIAVNQRTGERWIVPCECTLADPALAYGETRSAVHNERSCQQTLHNGPAPVCRNCGGDGPLSNTGWCNVCLGKTDPAPGDDATRPNPPQEGCSIDEAAGYLAEERAWFAQQLAAANTLIATLTAALEEAVPMAFQKMPRIIGSQRCNASPAKPSTPSLRTGGMTTVQEKAMVEPQCVQDYHTPRYDEHGKITPLVRSGGYMMVRRPRCMPFVMTEKDWRKLSREAS